MLKSEIQVKQTLLIHQKNGQFSPCNFDLPVVQVGKKFKTIFGLIQGSEKI